MEFCEKLQQLRKQSGMTQEQLAEQLFVSRTAVSKWESGRGYPNLDSLKGISKLFSVSIDELLSNGELLELAKEENRSNIGKMSGMIFGLLDVIAAAFFFLPLFGQREGGYVRAVTLLHCTGISDLMRGCYFMMLVAIAVFGIFELAAEVANTERFTRTCGMISVVLSVVAVLMCALSRQAYITVALFLLFVVKVALIMWRSRMP